ncbi:hypothetical protein ACROYT_G033194 [Oculina patagonica]
MPFPNRGWLLVLILTILSSNIRITISQGCTSLVKNANVRFTASSSVQGPGRPIVGENDVWCAGTPTRNQYLQVNLGFNLQFDQVIVQGKANSNRSVSQYVLLTSPDDDIYTTIPKDVGDGARVFYGPLFDGNKPVIQNLTTPVQAQYVRFNPKEPLSILENYMCMRIDILSCRNVPAPIDGGWTDWSAWSACPADKCLNAVRSRSRSCTDPAPAFGGQNCRGASGMNQLCPIDCIVPIDGSWGNWGAWSACSKTCGNGTATRSRQCDKPHQQNGGGACVGPAIESQECFVQHCPVDGNWSMWSAWSACSVTCGSGTQTRDRTCTEPAPAHGGLDCVGQPSERQNCMEPACPVVTTTAPPTTTPPPTPVTTPVPPVDGGWSNWTYTPCNQPCGPGQRNRTRTCTKPPPSGSGADCPGLALETLDCNEGPCVDPNMPEIDLAFAISATSASSNQSYALMQNTIKQLIDTYGVDKIHYSLIVYGASVVRVVNFNTSFPISASDLKAAIDAQPPLSGGPVLTDALQEAFRVFNETEVRPNAKKVLVVMPDANSGAADNSLSAAVKPVEDIGVLVLSVGVGGGVDRNELSVISPNPNDVISASLNENPSVVAGNIIDRILNRNIPEIEVGFAIRVSEIDSNAIFTVMQETRATINHRYASSQVRYNVIIYDEGKRPIDLNFGVNDQLSLDDLIVAANNTDPLPVDLQGSLIEAERLFRSVGSATAKKVFIALTDTAKSDNDTELIIAGDALRRQGMLVFSVNNNGNGVNAVTITQIDFLGVPTFTTDRSVVIAETIIKFALEINIPLIDLTFAISATSLQNATTFVLMQTTINNIVSQYDIFRIHYSVIVFGSVATTHIDFGSVIPDKYDLIRRVARLSKSPGNPDLVQALQHAKRVYESQSVRPDARRFLVVIMDNASVNNRNDLNAAVTDLDNLDVVIIGVGVGNSVNPTDNEIITKDPRHIITVGINKSPDELAREIIDAIFISIRTAGFSQWADWSTCTKSCQSGGVAGTQRRTRVCVKSRLGCIGATAETRECNTQFCQGCEERGPFADIAYGSSPDPPVQAAAWARLNTSDPGANQRAWCVRPDDVGNATYVQIDLGENVEIFRLATKGRELTGHWVTSYSISHSSDGLSFNFFQEDGQLKVFPGNTDPSSVVFNEVNITTPVKFIRFHPVSFNEQPCMQASVFGCTLPNLVGPSEAPFIGDEKAEIGVLIALWILAGILSFLLLMACCYYCCWHVCCGRGKKRKGLTAYRHTWIDDTDGYLIEDLDKRWRLPPVDIVSRAAEDEIQEVAIEMGNENPKPSGVIQFGIETDETKGKHVTAEKVFSETPQYSEDVGTVQSGASMTTMSSNDTGYRSAERRKRIKSETAASILAAGGGGDPRYVNQRRKSSGISNGGFIRSEEWLIDPSEPPKNRKRSQELKRSQSADEMAAIDYDMFEQRPGSADNAVRGELGRDGYMRMKQTSRDRVNEVDGGFPMGTADVAIGGIEAPETHIYDMAGQELTFATDNGVYRREQWSAVGEEGPGQLTEEGFREIHVQEEPPYAEIHFDDEGNILSVTN